MFEEFPRRSAASFSHLRMTDQPLPEDVGSIDKPFKGGAVRIRNQFASIEDRYDFRAVYIRSEKIEVITLFLFPQPSWALPVYGMEMVRLGCKPIVGVLDAVDLSRVDPAPPAFMSELREQYDYLPQSDDPPQWFQDCRSGADFFLRPTEDAELAAMAPVHDAALAGAAQALEAADRSADPAAHARALAHYKDHHRENSPGLPLMNRVFGQEWTDRYMRQHLFA